MRTPKIIENAARLYVSRRYSMSVRDMRFGSLPPCVKGLTGTGTPEEHDVDASGKDPYVAYRPTAQDAQNAPACSLAEFGSIRDLLDGGGSAVR